MDEWGCFLEFVVMALAISIPFRHPLRIWLKVDVSCAALRAGNVNFYGQYSVHQVAEDNGFVKWGVGASPPARGSTPAPRPKLGDSSYSLSYGLKAPSRDQSVVLPVAGRQASGQCHAESSE